jgi:hypothetical protein
MLWERAALLSLAVTIFFASRINPAISLQESFPVVVLARDQHYNLGPMMPWHTFQSRSTHSGVVCTVVSRYNLASAKRLLCRGEKWENIGKGSKSPGPAGVNQFMKGHVTLHFSRLVLRRKHVSVDKDECTLKKCAPSSDPSTNPSQETRS